MDVRFSIVKLTAAVRQLQYERSATPNVLSAETPVLTFCDLLPERSLPLFRVVVLLCRTESDVEVGLTAIFAISHTPSQTPHTVDSIPDLVILLATGNKPIISVAIDVFYV